MSSLYTRLHHGKESCSGCAKPVGRESLKACSSCRLVRYCSKECQKTAWPVHKKSCTNIDQDIAKNPEDVSLYAEITHWKNVWTGALRYICLYAFDLANTPRDRLATHCIMIQIEPRPDPPSRDRNFKMIGGEVLARGDFLKLCEKNKAPGKMVQTFKDGSRGNDTAQVILICEGFFRFIWFGYQPDEMQRARSRKSEASSLSADYWDDGLRDAIEAGDPPGIQNRLLEAIGQHNTLIYDAVLPPVHPRV